MIKSTSFRRLLGSLSAVALGLVFVASASAATYSISQTPLFITISMPANITVLLDDSGSMTWGHVPDALGDNAAAAVEVITTTNSTVSTVVTPGTIVSGTVTSTSAPLSASVQVANGTTNSIAVVATSSPLSGTVTATCTGTISHGNCSTGRYNYTCASGYTLNPASPTSGTSSTGSGYTCTKSNFTYSCPTGYNQSSPWTSSGSTSTSYGSDTCKQPTYDYSCPTGYTLTGPTSGTSSTGSGDSCSEPNYNYSCASGYTLSGASSGSTSTPPSGTTCGKVTSYNYTCPTGATQSSGWTASGTSSTAPTGDKCTLTTTTSVYTAFSSVYTPDTWHYKSAAFNPLAYDPTQVYSPGYNDTGTQLANAVFSGGAYCNPYNTSAGTIDISVNYQATVTYDPSTTCSSLSGASTNHTSESTSDEVNSCDYFTSTGSCHSWYNTSQAAFYYTYTPTSTTAVANGCGTHTYTSGHSTVTIPALSDDSCYTQITVSSSSGINSSDERTNFANWWSFYRTRNLTTNTSANRAFEGLSTTFRVAWRDLNTCSSFASTGCKGWSTTSYDNRIASFSGTHRQNFFDWLAKYPANGGTPLRSGLQSIGAYYQTSGVSSPYAFNPQVTDSPEYVCRPNYAVIMTDGLWNDSSSPSPAVNNADNTALTLPDGTAFAVNTHPYSDSTSSTMADVAFYYWAHSLRSDLGTSTSLQYMPYTKAITVVDDTNKTASLQPYWNPGNDPASWPHMVTFTVGLGMTSTVTNPDWNGSTYAGGYSDVVTGTTAWPAATSNSANNVYDLWHTAINSRGQFFSADSPTDVQTAFNDIVNRIQGRVGSSSAIAVNSTRLDSDTFIYQAQFNSGGWTGEVLAFPINADGSIGTQAWAASGLIPAASSRSIYSWNETLNSSAGGGISFLWANLSTTEQTNLNTSYFGVNDSNGSLRVNYLRGDQSQEQSQGGNFRTRSDILGDIVNSNPEFVGDTSDFGDSVLSGTEGSSYPTFLTTKSTRTPMLYVGSNDGMMHAINANTGVEQFDYVPRGVYPNLSALTDPDYSHQYYVDGAHIAVDAYISGNWKTLMVGTTGAGAREVYLLDVTDPSSFSTSSILWDYDGATRGDNNMGYSIPAATIARMHDGDWYVIFGNGYNSTNQHAIIYMYNIRTKALTTFDTGVGSGSNPNGMSAPSPVDFDGDRVVDALYAGDLLGNVWKLDVSGSTASSWKYYSYGSSGSTATPFFTAKDSSGNVQPITDRIQVGLNSSSQVMLYFGTGTYFETNDNTVGTSPPVMSFYGLIDDKANGSADKISGRSNLLEQYVVAQSTNSGNTFRITTAYPMTTAEVGWFMDLNYTTAQGERVVSDAVLDNGRVIFTTLIPQGNACQFGGISWLMELDSDTGGSLTTISPFDVNGDGKVNASDLVTVTYTDPASGKTVTATTPVGGEESNVGIIKTPGIITSGTLQYKYYSGSTGSIGMTTESAPTSGGRVSWQVVQQ